MLSTWGRETREGRQLSVPGTEGMWKEKEEQSAPGLGQHRAGMEQSSYRRGVLRARGRASAGVEGKDVGREL